MTLSRAASNFRKPTVDQSLASHRLQSLPPKNNRGLVFDGKSRRRRPAPKKSNDTIASSALNPVPPSYRSQISIPSNAMWRCKYCFNLYPIEHARLDRPLGYFRCTTCHCSPQLAIINIPRIEQMFGIEYAIMVPNNSENVTEAPHSLFVWVCCTCGRSWPQTPVPQRLSPQTPQQRPHRGRSLRRIFHRNEPVPKNQSQPKVEPKRYTTYIITFNSGCLCAHYTCENCYRASVLAEGESISRRLQPGEIVKVSQEQIQRKRAELIERGDDPGEFFP